jgi:hypothetical protein
MTNAKKSHSFFASNRLTRSSKAKNIVISGRTKIPDVKKKSASSFCVSGGCCAVIFCRIVKAETRTSEGGVSPSELRRMSSGAGPCELRSLPARCLWRLDRLFLLRSNITPNRLTGPNDQRYGDGKQGQIGERSKLHRKQRDWHRVAGNRGQNCESRNAHDIARSCENYNMADDSKYGGHWVLLLSPPID